MPHDRLGDERGFIHKKILGGVGRIAGLLPIPGAPIISTAARFIAGGGRRGGKTTTTTTRTIPRTLTARPTGFSEAGKELGRNLKFGGAGAGGGGIGCILPFRRDPRTGECKIFLGERSGPDNNGSAFAGAPVGEAVMGRYGTAQMPDSMTIERSVCKRGMTLGNDGLCYNKGQINNKQRMWPKGRKPLLTGGEMRAISIASRAGKRMDAATVRLRGMGLMKQAPKPRKPKQHSVAHP